MPFAGSRILRLAGFILLFISTVIPMAAIAPASARENQTSEYRLKGAYLLNLAKFIEWPSVEKASDEQPFTFCLIGIEKQAHDIDKAFADKVVHGRKVITHHMGFADSTTQCQVLFVGSIGNTRLSHVLKANNRGSLLVVGETPDFIIQGGDINFFVEPGRLRFEINPLSLEHKGLKISSKLLRLARILEVPVHLDDQ